MTDTIASNIQNRGVKSNSMLPVMAVSSIVTIKKETMLTTKET